MAGEVVILDTARPLERIFSDYVVSMQTHMINNDCENMLVTLGETLGEINGDGAVDDISFASPGAKEDGVQPYGGTKSLSTLGADLQC